MPTANRRYSRVKLCVTTAPRRFARWLAMCCNWAMSRARVLLFALVLSLPFSPRPAAAARLQRWVYYSVNLWVDSNITSLQSVLTNAAQAGYTHVLLSDSKFSRLATMDAHYFANLAKVKATAAALGLE